MKKQGGTKKYKSVLGWDSPFEIFCKLEREMHRMQEAETLEDLVDHTMNFALTAYHMIDWVWETLQQDPSGPKAKFEIDNWTTAIGFEPKALDELQSWAERECPELGYCRQLANATKHLSCRPKKKKVPTAEFEVKPTAKWENHQKKEPFTSILDDHRAENWRLVMIDDENKIDLKEVFQEKVFLFWDDLVRRIYIG